MVVIRTLIIEVGHHIMIEVDVNDCGLDLDFFVNKPNTIRYNFMYFQATYSRKSP